MLGFVLSMFRIKRVPRRARAGTAGAAEALAFFSERIATMPAVTVPRAANDDPLAQVVEEVERELKRAGYLR